MFGGVEAGGTKFVCAVGETPGDLIVTRIPTSSPGETLAQVAAFFEPYESQLQSIGVASFGPIDLRRESPTYGFITATPKPEWANTDMLGEIRRQFELPVGFDTDVNGAALAEHRWGAGKEVDTLIYLTLGTGIGGGIVIHGQPVHGLVHPEMGHIMLSKAPNDSYRGACPFHGDRCFEGLASGPAIQERWGQKAELLDFDHPAWRLEADYIAQALTTYICTLSPERVIVGGGLSVKEGLIEEVRERVSVLLSGYVRSESIQGNIDNYIVLPELAGNSGVMGAIELAKDAMGESAVKQV